MKNITLVYVDGECIYGINSPKLLSDYVEHNNKGCITTQNVLCVLYYRNLVKAGIIKNGMVACDGKKYPLDKNGKYKDEKPYFEKEYENFFENLEKIC